MKRIKLLFIGGAMLLLPYQIKAEQYYLGYICSYYPQKQHSTKPHKAPAAPLCIDVTNNIFTMPERVMGYTLIISNKEETYTYYITSNTFSVPENLDGYYNVTITNGNVSYQGEIKFEL